MLGLELGLGLGLGSGLGLGLGLGLGVAAALLAFIETVANWDHTLPLARAPQSPKPTITSPSPTRIPIPNLGPSPNPRQVTDWEERTGLPGTHRRNLTLT